MTEVRRPVTPINDAVKVAPSSVEELVGLVRKRIIFKKTIERVTIEDQQELVGILMTELSLAWPDLRKQAPDPFLDDEGNKELERMVAIHAVQRVEELFFKFVTKLATANKIGVFSPDANLSRLKLQLGFEASKCLNILRMRRRLAALLRRPGDDQIIEEEDPYVTSVKDKLFQLEGKTLPKDVTITIEEAENLSTQLELQELERLFPNIKFSNFQLDDQMKQLMISEEKSDKEVQKSQITPFLNQTNHQIDDAATNKMNVIESRTGIKETSKGGDPAVVNASTSLQDIPLKENNVPLSESGKLRESKSTHLLGLVLNNSTDSPQSDEITAENRSEPLTINEDLEELIRNNYHQVLDDKCEDGLYPLLQATAKLRKSAHTNSNTDEELPHSSETNTDKSTDGKHQLGPDVRPIEIPNKIKIKVTPRQGVYYMCQPRVTDRIIETPLKLEMCEPIFNPFLGEITDEDITHLDRNLFVGNEISEVYKEIGKTISKDHLKFDKDPYVIPTGELGSQDNWFASYRLADTKNNKVFNDEIVQFQNPPWTTTDASEWRNSPKIGNFGREEMYQRCINSKQSETGKGNVTNSDKSSSTWLAWWRSTINFDDYLKFVSSKGNDFLSRAFHLYDSDDGDDEEDEKRLAAEKIKLEKKRKHKEKLSKIRHEKTRFTPGVWNASSVFLGGLGKDPEIENEQNNDDCEPQINNKNEPTPNQKNIEPNLKLNEKHESSSVDLQDRFQNIWSTLRMPENDRSKMAIKYGQDMYQDDLPEVLCLWENAAKVIEKRESLITTLERFEYHASDPDRFFVKGKGGSALHRENESETRQRIHKEIDAVEQDVRSALGNLSSRFSETVCYAGRNYIDKMCKDKTEMLYWLQQQRRLNRIQNQDLAQRPSSVSRNLPPISLEEFI